ncbi:unnamed protein product [Rotaria socialis]|uniref:DNA-directed DNA polymerase n=1 Tax=Rotaria socialis TaxID=392032 RepID=A0A821RE46_9BILA|nr:unnamed protein product [Rotaria socialis]
MNNQSNGRLNASVSRQSTLSQREKPYARKAIRDSCSTSLNNIQNIEQSFSLIDQTYDSEDDFKTEKYVLNKAKKNITVGRKTLKKSSVNINKENVNPLVNITAFDDSDDDFKIVQQTPRKPKKRVSPSEKSLHKITKNNKNVKKSCVTKDSSVQEKINTQKSISEPTIIPEQTIISEGVVNTSIVSAVPNVDSPQQLPIFGERCIEDVMAFIDEQEWDRKVEADKELWQQKLDQFSISIGDHHNIDLLDINTDVLGELVGNTIQLQNNENIPQTVQPDVTQQQSVQSINNQIAGEYAINNQSTDHEFSTINMELFRELMDAPNPIELPTTIQITQPSINKPPAIINEKNQPEQCLGADDPDFAPPVESKENPYIVYKAANKKSPIIGVQRKLKRLQRNNDNRRLDNIKKFNTDVENRCQADVFKMLLESVAKHHNSQGIMTDETRNSIKSCLTKSLVEQQNTYHDEFDEAEIREQLLAKYQYAYNEIWTIVEKINESIFAKRRLQQNQQSTMITQPQPQTENPTPSSSTQSKEKVLTIKLNGVVQLKRSYEHISIEKLTGENMVKRKMSNNKKCLNTNIFSSETESEFDSEAVINNNNNNNNNTIGPQQVDQLQTFETESCLNQILVTAEIHANPDYEPVLNKSNEIHSENTLRAGTDISLAIDPPAVINDLNSVNTVNTINTAESLESINLANDDNDGSIPSIRAPAPDCFNVDLDLNDFIIGSREIACTETFFINESIIDVNKKYSRVDIKYTINVKNVWHMHKKTVDDNILQIFEDFLHHINLSINEYFSRVGRTGFVQVRIGNHECTFDASSPYVRFSEDIVFSLIDQFSDQIQSGSYVSFNQIYCDVTIIFEGYGHGSNDVRGVNIGSLLNKKSFIISHLNSDTNKRDCLFRAVSYVLIRSEKIKKSSKGASSLHIRAVDIDAKARLLSTKCELPLEIAATPVHLEKIALKLDIRIGCYMIEENTGLIKTFYTNADLSNKNKTTVLLCLHKNCYYPLLYPKSLIIAKNKNANLCWGCLRELLLEGLTLITEAPIRRGTSIMSLKLGSIMFRDSYLFSPVKLRKFPELFNLSTDIRKGMFPYRFIKSEADIDYKGDFPSEDYFELADLSNKEIDEYKAYKKSFENKPWSAREELLSYCIDDVKILWLGFTKFRQGYIKNFQIDPIESNITLAGLCIQVYTSTFMPKNVLGLIDDRPQRKWFSPISLVYLGWLQQSGQIPVDCDIITAQQQYIFKDYIDCFFKQKVHASGYPERVKTEQDKDQYIADYKTNMNIDLEKDKIKLDPPARLTAKLNLNSLWGRMGLQTRNKDKYALVNSPEEMHEFLSDQQYKVSDIMCGSEKALVRYKQTEVAQSKIPKAVNSVVAAFVTCYGRLMLYELMEKAGNNLVYGDTDSCMIITRRSGYVPSPDFVWPPHLQKPLDLEMGEYLGMLTDEVAEKYGSDYVATRFVSPCAKTYSLAIENLKSEETPKTFKYIMRCKGFGLSNKTKDTINHDSYVNLVKKRLPNISVPTTQFRGRHEGGIDLITAPKKLSFVYSKRKIVNNYETREWGYKEPLP